MALGQFFGRITRERARARVVVHKIIAAGDYVWAHVNFLNLFSDDPADTGIAGVDIYRMDDGQGGRTLGRPAARGGAEELSSHAGPEYSVRQPERNVLRGMRPTMSQGAVR